MTGGPATLVRDNDACVVATKAKAVTHRNPHLASIGRSGRVVQIAFRVLVFQIDRWRNHTGHHRLGCDDRFDAAAGSQRMAERTLGTTDRQLFCMLAKNLFDGKRLGLIAQRCAGAVSIDVSIWLTSSLASLIASRIAAAAPRPSDQER